MGLTQGRADRAPLGQDLLQPVGRSWILAQNSSGLSCPLGRCFLTVPCCVVSTSWAWTQVAQVTLS